MGDRTWVNITVFEEDYEEFIGIMGEPNQVSDYPPFCELEYEEVNYAGWNQLDEAAQKGLRFYGSHGSGGSYGYGSFACLQTNQLIKRNVEYVQVNSEYSPVATIKVLQTGEIVMAEESKTQVQRYFNALDRITSLDPEHKLHNKI